MKRLIKRCVKRTILWVLSLIAAFATQYDIPTTRTTIWNAGVTVGVVGGIPTTRTTIINVFILC